jgi:hypothetical protein
MLYAPKKERHNSSTLGTLHTATTCVAALQTAALFGKQRPPCNTCGAANTLLLLLDMAGKVWCLHM